MTGQGIICQLKNLAPIEGANRIQQARILGETIITSIEREEGEVGILFDCETQLSHEYCKYNNLYRDSTMNLDPTQTGYIDEKNRRIKPIRLRGVKCSGLWMPLSSLDFTNPGENQLEIGMQFNDLNGHPICQKYVPKITKQPGAPGSRNRKGRTREELVPTFAEHFSTDHLMRNEHRLHPGQKYIITEKLHGTSGRCGLMLVEKKLNWWKTLMAFFATGKWNRSYNEYEFVVGSRRTIKAIGDEERENAVHFYDSNIWKIASEQFRDKLEPGDSVYFEIVGHLPSGKTIMGSCNNKKLKKFLDERVYGRFLRNFGDETVFRYGTSPNGEDQYRVYIYRITTTNELGRQFDFSWEQVKLMSEKWNIPHVPELEQGIIHSLFDLEDARQDFLSMVEEYCDDERPSTIDPTHISEGVCVRLEDGCFIPTILKHKSYAFKVLEGIIKDTAEEADIEESN